jgi:hypothetical protein
VAAVAAAAAAAGVTSGCVDAFVLAAAAVAAAAVAAVAAIALVASVVSVAAATTTTGAGKDLDLQRLTLTSSTFFRGVNVLMVVGAVEVAAVVAFVAALLAVKVALGGSKASLAVVTRIAGCDVMADVAVANGAAFVAVAVKTFAVPLATTPPWCRLEERLDCCSDIV